MPPNFSSTSSSFSSTVPLTSSTALAPRLRALMALLMRWEWWVWRRVLPSLSENCGGSYRNTRTILSLDVEMSVVVVVELIGRGAIAGKYKRPAD